MSETKTMVVPNKTNFQLTKVNISDKKGVDIHYEITEIVGDETYANKHHVTSAKDVHPDLKKLLKNLRPIMARVLKLTSFKSVFETPEFKATKKQQEYGETYYEKMLEDIEVRGISLNGSGDNCGVVITTVYTVGNGQKISINSHNIKLNVETFGFEEVLETIIADVENEVYDFLFNGKKAQLELFDASGNGTVKEEENLFSGAEETNDAVNDAEETETEGAETESEENDDAVSDDDDAESFSDEEEQF